MSKSLGFASFLLAAAFVSLSATSSLAVTYSTLLYPGANSGVAQGIDGANIVGTYVNPSGTHGFLYNGTSWTTINHPLATAGTTVVGISGNTIVGTYADNGDSTNTHTFLYDGVSYTTLFNSLAYGNSDRVRGVWGNNVVGSYQDQAGRTRGYLYNGSAYTSINHPLAINGISKGTSVNGISGNNLVGTFDTATGKHGFLFDGSTYKTIDDPLGVNGTVPMGISGNLIVGYFIDSNTVKHGFLYNGSTFTTLDEPDAFISSQYKEGTSAYGISGNTVVGKYFGKITQSTYSDRGFVAVVPEPSSLVLFLIGSVVGIAFVVRRSRDKV